MYRQHIDADEHCVYKLAMLETNEVNMVNSSGPRTEPCVSRQVTLCDPIWQVTLRSSAMDSHRATEYNTA